MCVCVHIFVVGEHRDFKFGVQVDHSKSQPMNDKLYVKGVVTSSDPFKTYLERLKLETSNFVYWLVM